MRSSERLDESSGAMVESWFLWAALAAVFAALTAIFAKVGVEKVDSDLATLLRTMVVVVVLGGLVAITGKWSNPFNIPSRSLWFLVLSALATGASWVCYFRALKAGPAAKVAPVDKFSIVLVALFAAAFLGEKMGIREWLGVGLIALGVLVLARAR